MNDMVLDAVMPRIHGTSGLSAIVSGFRVQGRELRVEAAVFMGGASSLH